ncbi:nitrous oxide reductase family maturation protein NosD [Streptomyces sp. NBC_01481]|uniref:right-handed parallel beta-helix repeat-containing protein n=1 Tax=Streptomyces sp. NBC_01481 TaxID=2975869 RepID=UPI00225622E7|nr:right-handed parallel beta-helix repeat-containing protein [Streptomyces sp. NBC_01481]MCX4584329.1 right-handed parallel beta-helix repeat-containing protein [Streptomyces sp. NBC_01481]
MTPHIVRPAGGSWRAATLGCVLVTVLLCGGCSGASTSTAGHGNGPARSTGSATIRVPGQAATINAALDRARPGDLVLVSPGVYHESVTVRTDRVVLRGTDRNRVVIDGEGRRSNGVVVTAAGVSVENLTVRNHLLNGVLVTGMSDADGGLARGSDGYQHLDPARFPPLDGFRVRYVTAHANGLYGIYAFNARHGVLERNYASGSADSGLYVGQCKPCHVLVQDNIAEHNAVGYEGTNASGPVWVLHNRFAHNRVGLTVNTDYQEAYVPQTGGVVAGNLVADNNAPDTPEQADGGFGIGIGIAGGQHNALLRNRVSGNSRAGIVLASHEDVPPLDNRLEDNNLSANAVDISYQASARAPGQGNCLRGNTLHRTLPEDLPHTAPCPGGNSRTSATAPRPRTAPPPAGIPFLDVAPPSAQPQLPHAQSAPATPAVRLPGDVDPDRVPLPGPDLLAVRPRQGVTVR